MSKPSDSVAWWRQILQAQARSGLTIAAYRRQARVSEASFYSWRRKLRAAPNFAEVRVALEPGRTANSPHAPRSDVGALEVRLTNGRRIVVRGGFDRRTLLDLVATLERDAAAMNNAAPVTNNAAPVNFAARMNDADHGGRA